MAFTGLDAVQLAAAGILVLLNGFFVASEFAIVKVRPTQVRALLERGDPRAKVAKHMLDNLDGYLSATQLGITAASLGLGWIGEPAIADVIEGPLGAVGIGSGAALHTISFAIAFGVITFLHVVVGELAPKSIAIRHPVDTTRRIARPMVLFYWLSWPFMAFFNGAALLLLKAMGVEPATPTETLHTEAELEALLSDVEEGQVPSAQAREVLANVFAFRRLRVRQVMTHRTKVTALDLQKSMAENLRIARESGFSRFPLIDGGMDQIVGAVHLKDIVRIPEDAGPEALREIARQPVVVPETSMLDTALQTLRDSRAKLLVVADEHGGTEGIATIEDIMEELVGELEDAFDQEPADYVALSEGRLLVRGDAALHDLDDVLGLATEDPAISTVGGLMIEHLGHVPTRGETVEVDGWQLTATDTTTRRVRQVVAERLEEPDGEDDDAEDGDDEDMVGPPGSE